ncbi:MAG TPA: P1 family peptidase [Ktedonobacterales bacterium]|nr:P1 family peptidase [Ktedonobacterales bacterium]
MERHIERHDDLCDVEGILVGHDTQAEAATGCTVILCQRPAVGAVDVRGGAPATRETDLLDPTRMMREVHAIVLSGGSAFGLEAASGVARALEARGVGFDVGVTRVPIVPAAALFDLSVGRADVRPDAAAGVRALAVAAGGPVAQGCVGAGTGATIGKSAGPALCVKAGVGSASGRLDAALGGFTLGALVAVNAVGDIYDADSGRLVAGARHPSGQGWLRDGPPPTAAHAGPFPGANTTLAVIATDAPLNKADLNRLAQVAHDGFALAIRPTHTPFDGDLIFALSTAPAAATAGPVAPALLAALGALAAQTVARAIVRGVRAATSLAGIPALRDLSF